MTLSLRSLHVAEAEAVAAFRRALDFDRHAGTDDVPPLFVMRWLAEPVVRATIASAVPPGYLPLQTRQHLRLLAPLHTGERYAMTTSVTAMQSIDPMQVRLDFQITTETGEPVMVGEIEFVCVLGKMP